MSVAVARTHHKLVVAFRKAYVLLVRVGSPFRPVVVEAFELELVLGIAEGIVSQTSHIEPDFSVEIPDFVHKVNVLRIVVVEDVYYRVVSHCNLPNHTFEGTVGCLMHFPVSIVLYESI